MRRRVALVLSVLCTAVFLWSGTAAPPVGAAPGQGGDDPGGPPAPTVGMVAEQTEPECPEVGLDVIFLIDNSGSMAGNDPDQDREAAAKVFVDRMREQDRAGVIHWASSAGGTTLFTLDTPTNRSTLKADIDAGTNSGGGTNISAAVQAGTSVLSQSPAGRARVAILLSDGEDSGYDTSRTTAAAAAEVTIHAIGLSDDAGTATLQGIASGTGGTYQQLNDPSQLSSLYDQIASEVLGESAGTAGCAPVVPSETFGPNGALLYRCPCEGDAGRPVDTRTGNTWETLPGLGIAGRGPDLTFELTYNSFLADVGGAAGNGWSTTFDMRLEHVSPSEITIHQESGSTVSFFDDGSGGWAAPARFDGDLVENTDGSFTYTRAQLELFRFAADGRLLVISDLDGYETTFTYPTGSDEVDYVEDEAGRRLDVTWTSGRITDIADTRPAGEGGARHLVLAYEPDGDLGTYTDVGGGQWKMGYDGSHRLTSKVSPRFTAITDGLRNEYDAAGRVIKQTDEIEGETIFQYGSPGVGDTTVTFPDGDKRIDHYESGRRESVTYAAGTADEYVVQFTYDSQTFAPLTMVDGRGKTTTYGYNADGRRTSMTDPLGRSRTWEYNGLGLVTEAAHNRAAPGNPAQWVVDEMAYSSSGHLELLTKAAGSSSQAVTDYVYGDSGHPEDVTTIVDPRGKEWDFAYHATRGDLVSTTDPLGNVTTRTTNTLGWVLTVVEPKGNVGGGTPADHRTIYTYNAYGQEVTRTNPLGDVRRTWYDANGNVSHIWTDLGTGDTAQEDTGFLYDEADQLVWRAELGRDTKYAYWPDGSLKAWRDGNNRLWSYGYDHAGRLTSETDPNGAVANYAYDDHNNLVWAKQPVTGATCTSTPKVGCTTYGYDDAGQATSIDYSDATPDVTGISYDGAGRRTAATIAGATEAWVWDDLGRLTSQTDRNARTVLYGWDDGSNLTSIRYPGETTSLTRAYDDAGRFTSTTDPAGRVSTFGYDANGNWTDTIFPTSSGNTDQRAYDRANQITGVTWKKGTTTLGSVTSPRNNEGLVTDTTPTGLPGAVAEAYTYDGLDQLTGVGSDTLAHDGAGNLTTTEDGRLQVLDPASQLCWTSPTATTGTCATPTSDATTFAYDSRGNRTNRTDAAGVSMTYGYDLDDRLTSTSETGPAPITAMDGAPVSGDFDGDGDDEVLFYKPGAGTDWMWEGRPRAQFGRRARPYAIGAAGYQPVAADFDGDGNDDIFWYSPSGGDSIWFFESDGTYVSRPAAVATGLTPIAGDFDGDGFGDVYWYGAGATADAIWWGDTDVDTGSAFTVQSVSRGGSYIPAAGDIDGNGYDDIFWHAPGSTTDVVYFGAGGRNSWISRNQTVSNTYALAIGDYDADGKDDVMFSGTADSVWWGDDANTFGPAAQKALTATPPTAVAGNFNGDSTSDLFLYDPAATGDTVFWGANRTDFGTYNLVLGLSSDPTTSTYRYNSDGPRSGKTVNGLSVTEFTWNRAGGLPMLLSQHQGSTTVHIVYGPQGTPVYQYDPTNAFSRLMYHQDHLGSTRMTTTLFGDVNTTFTYDAYGNTVSDTTAAGGTRPLLTYAGEYRDAETGFYYLRSRYYDPATGSFTTRDPALATSGDAYSYAASNPVNATDPTGLWCVGSVCTDSVGEAIEELDALLPDPPDCPFGKNPDGGCKGARWVEQYADDVSVAAGFVGGACAAAAILSDGWLAGPAATCVTASAVVGGAASILHTVVTCADWDKYCRNSATATALGLVTLGLGKVAFPSSLKFTASLGGSWGRFAQACGGLVFPTYATGLIAGFVDTTERPK